MRIVAFFVAVGAAMTCISASAQVYRYDPRPAARPHPLPAGICPAVSRFGPEDAAAPVDAPFPLAASDLAFDPARPPVLTSARDVPGNVEVEVAVVNGGRRARKGWVELSVCRLGGGGCEVGGVVLGSPPRRPKMLAGQRALVRVATKSSVGAGQHTVQVVLFDDTERPVDRVTLPVLSIGTPRAQLAEVIFPRQSAWTEGSPRTGVPGPMTLRASLRNTGDAPGVVQVAFVVTGTTPGVCGAEMYSNAVVVPEHGGTVSIGTQWTPPRRGMYSLAVMLLDPAGRVLDERRGLRLGAYGE